MASLLRTRLIEDLRIRNHASRTIDIYVRCVALFAKYFRRSPEDLGAVREYQLYLREEKKASWAFFNQTVSALRYLYGKTLQRDSYVNPGALTPHDAEHSAPKNNPVRFNARGVSVHLVEHRNAAPATDSSCSDCHIALPTPAPLPLQRHASPALPHTIPIIVAQRGSFN